MKGTKEPRGYMTMLDVFDLPTEVQHRIMPEFFVSARRRRATVIVLCCLLLAGSYYSGPIVRYGIFAIPLILLLAWYDGFSWSAFVGVVVVLVRLSMLVSYKDLPWPRWMMFVNGGLAAIGVVLLTWFVARAGRLARQIRLLQGVLWTCFYCGRIEDDNHEWMTLQRYITKHSEAIPAHRLCPACSALGLPK